MIITTIDCKLKYPYARRDVEQIDYYHGKEVIDPYRWLETLGSNETKKFITDQNKVTTDFKDHTKWNEINEKIKKFGNHLTNSMPEHHGNYYYFYEKREKQQKQKYN